MVDPAWLRQELADLKRTGETLVHQGHPIGLRLRTHYNGIVRALNAPNPSTIHQCVVCDTVLPEPTRKGGRQRKYCSRECSARARRHPELYDIATYTRPHDD